MIRWLHRLPTPEEVEAHAKAHPVAYADYGFWLRSVVDGLPALLRLTVRDGRVFDVVTTINVLPSIGHRWLPVTADGVPVGVEIGDET